MDSIPVMEISSASQKSNIIYTLERLLDPSLPSYAFKQSFQSLLASSSPGLAWQDANPTLREPFTSSIREALYSRTNDTAPRYDHAMKSLAIVEALNTNLKQFKAQADSCKSITPQAMMAVLGGKERFDEYMDVGMLAWVIGLRDRARKVKSALEYRIWIVNAEVEGMVWPEIGDLLIKLMTGEANWHCTCGNLFSVDQENREMVIEWLKK